MANETKVKANIDELNKLIRVLKKEKKVRIGIIGSKATAEHDTESGLTNAKLGAIHEFGADIEHPGGTPYKILANGQARFVKKSEGEGLPVTEAHDIHIPRRSFLLDPLKDKLPDKIKKLRKYIFKQIFDKKAPDDFYRLLMQESLKIVKDAFNNGYPGWKPLTAATRRRPRGTNKILMDTRGLRDSITGKIVE